MNGSMTISPSTVKSLINHSGREIGKVALWLRLAHSVAMCRTLLGYTQSFPSQLDPFLPKPLITFDSSRLRSVALRFPSLFFAQEPIGTRTASWNILNLLCFVKCRHLSHASRNRFGHLPG